MFLISQNLYFNIIAYTGLALMFSPIPLMLVFLAIDALYKKIKKTSLPILKAFKKPINIVFEHVFGFEKIYVRDESSKEDQALKLYVHKYSGNELDRENNQLSYVVLLLTIGIFNCLTVVFLNKALIIKERTDDLKFCKKGYECFLEIDYNLNNVTETKDVCKLNYKTIISEQEFYCYKFGIDSLGKLLDDASIFFSAIKLMSFILQCLVKFINNIQTKCKNKYCFGFFHLFTSLLVFSVAFLVIHFFGRRGRSFGKYYRRNTEPVIGASVAFLIGYTYIVCIIAIIPLMKEKREKTYSLIYQA